MSALETLAGWAAETSDAHGDLAYARAGAAVTDTLACMIAGARDPATISVREAVTAGRLFVKAGGRYDLQGYQKTLTGSGW